MAFACVEDKVTIRIPYPNVTPHNLQPNYQHIFNSGATVHSEGELKKFRR